MTNLKPGIVCLRIPMTPRTIEAHLADLCDWLNAHASEENSEQYKRVKQRFDHWSAKQEKAQPLEFN